MYFRRIILTSAILIGLHPIAYVAIPSSADDGTGADQVVVLTNTQGEPTEVASAGLAEQATTPEVAPEESSAQPSTAEPASTPSAVVSPDEHSSPESATAGEASIWTRTIETTGFTLAALTWPADQHFPETASIEMRVLQDGSWSEWLPVEAENAEPGSERGGSEPFITGSAQSVEVRIFGGQDALPADLELSTYADDEAEATTDVLIAEADAWGIRPLPSGQNEAGKYLAGKGIRPRSAWGGSDHGIGATPDYARLRAAVVHHTAGTNNYQAWESAGIIRQIYLYHARKLGWGDIGYNFLVDKYGQIFEGASGSMDAAADQMVVGAHAYGFNTGTMGVSVLGNYETASPNAAIVDSLTTVISARFNLAGLNGTDMSGMSYRGTALPRIFGHYQTYPTACPGKNLIPHLAEIRHRVGAPEAIWPVPADGELLQTYAAAGGNTAKLGQKTSGQICGLTAGGCYQYFRGGVLIWSPATGVHDSFGAIREAWAASGFENGRLGYPVSNEVCGQKDGGCYQLFQGGAITWSPATGAHTSWGAIRETWAANGYENGRLGYPVTSEVCGQKDGGCYQLFQGGAITWSPATGAHTSWGAIREAWAASGFENGFLGYPITDEICGLKDGGCYQHYQRGTIVWSPATGAHVSLGGIRAKWAATGYENGPLGYPTSDEICTTVGICYQTYQGGVIHWHPRTGARIS